MHQPTLGDTRMTDKTQHRTVDGKPMTEETIQQLADEAEAGYDTSALRRQGGANRWARPRRE